MTRSRQLEQLLNELPDDRLPELLDFLQRLASQSKTPQGSEPVKGTSRTEHSFGLIHLSPLWSANCSLRISMTLAEMPDAATVFIDANVFVYHFTGVSPECKGLRDVPNGLRFVVSLELIFFWKFSIA